MEKAVERSRRGRFGWTCAKFRGGGRDGKVRKTRTDDGQLKLDGSSGGGGW